MASAVLRMHAKGLYAMDPDKMNLDGSYQATRMEKWENFSPAKFGRSLTQL